MRKKFDSKLIRWLAGYFGVLAILLLTGAFLYNSFEKMTNQQSWVTHSLKIIVETEAVMSSAKDAETGVRGFILSGNEEYLAPFYTGSADAKAHAAQVESMSIDNLEQARNARTLSVLIEQRLGAFESMIERRREGPQDAPAVRKYLSEGKTVMDALRNHINKMKVIEDTLLQQRVSESQNSRQFFLYALLASTVLSILILSIAFGQFRRGQLRVLEEAAMSERQVWIKANVAEVSRLSAGDLSLEELGSQVMAYFAKTVEILAGKIYVMKGGQVERVASFGIPEDKLSASTAIDRSLVLEAIRKPTIWQLSDIPENYWRIQSGLGESKPRNLIFLPMAFQGQPFALMELGAFQDLKADHLEMLEKVLEILAINLHAAQSREHLHALVEETQAQAEELQAQQEELRTSNEELEQQARALEAQQESMAMKNSELEGIRKDLEFKARELQLSSQYKSEFLAKMSHELRTPLNGLLILSSLLFENKEKTLTEQQQQFAKSIYNAGNDLLTLINDILDLSKIEARKLRLNPEEVSIETCLHQMKLVFEPQATSKGLSIEMNVAPELQNVKLLTDRQRLEQILRNFLSNAIKFTETGKIEIEARPVPGDKLGRIDLSIKDSGVGIPMEKQALVFEAFEQADGSISRKYGGTGLGLTISRELAALLGGEIRLESVEGQGSRFIVRLPKAMPMELVPASVAEVSPGRQAGNYQSHFEGFGGPAAREDVPRAGTSGAHAMNQEAANRIGKLVSGEKVILIVEDDDKFRAAVSEAAIDYGFQALQVEDGELALAILQKMTPDAILLDIKLPGISGMGILEMIKQMPHLRHVPVHMISAMDYQLNALRMGALGYLTKPVTIEKVKSALDRIEHILTDKVRRVLLIEDDARQLEAVTSLISGTDVEVVTADNGAKAIEVLKLGGIDCIILDLTLPDVSGIDLLSQLSQLQISLPPIVIYTGKDLSPSEEEKLRKYSQSIIIKGVRSPERLLDEVNLFLHRVEALLPQSKRDMLSHLRSQDQTFEGKNVLLVDDDLRNLFALTSALESRGFAVLTAKNGIEAIDMLETHEEVDMVLMDIMMPKMDGYEAMRRIRKHERTRLRQIPIIALTAKAMKEDHEKCIEAGASDYLPKPVNLDNLYTAMKVWFVPKGFFA